MPLQIKSQASMFESSEFLAHHLPQYLDSVASDDDFAQQLSQGQISGLELLSQLFGFCHRMFRTTKTPADEYDTLTTVFPYWQAGHVIRPSFACKQTRRKLGKVLETIKSNIDEIEFSFAELYLLLQYFNLNPTLNNLSREQMQQQAAHISNFLGELRIKLEFYKMDNIVRDFDDYIVEIFQYFFRQNIKAELNRIIRVALSLQTSNLSEKTVEYIQHKLPPIQVKICSFKYQKKPLVSDQNQAFQSLPLANINSFHSQSNLSKSSSQQCLQKQAQKYSARQSSTKTEQKPLFAHKNKLIAKNRTIYYQRKTVHVPKVKQAFEGYKLFESQRYTMFAEKDKKTQKTDAKSTKNEISDFSASDENDNFLVGSTPKVSKKMSTKVISQKLFF